MKSICIKTNDTHLLNYLLNEFDYIEIDKVCISTNQFKNYKNIIIHYTGNENSAFIHEVSCILSCFVIDEIEESILKRLILKNYFYFEALERKEILDVCYDIFTDEFNEYFDKKYEEPKPDNNGTDNVYPDNNYTFINNIHQTITNNKYVTHKTTVLDSKSDSNSITVSYMVYDPLTEFTSVYIVVKLGDLEVGRYTVDPSSTTYDIKGLLPGQEYTLEFYYDFKDNGNVVSQKFDEIKDKTKSVNGQITLDKVSANSVSYILKVDGSIDYAKANLYIDDVLVATDSNLNLELAKNGGYTGLFSYSGVGKVAKIVIEDATLNGANMGIIATYKYIL